MDGEGAGGEVLFPVSTRATARLRQNPESFSLLPVVLLFSVSTSGPGAPAPGSQRQKILRALRVFVVKKSLNPSHYAPTHPNFHPTIFQIFAQLLSEHRHLCVNNPGVVDWERRQTPMVQASIACLAPPAPIHGGPCRLRPFNCAGDFQPCRICRHGGDGPSARLNPAEASLMFPSAGYLRALFFPDYDAKTL